VPVISNSSPLIALTQIGRLDLLRQLHTSICIPPAVAREVEPTVVSESHHAQDVARSGSNACARQILHVEEPQTPASLCYASGVPRTELVLRIFVAAPEDVQDEVSILSEIIEELNRAHSRDSGIRLEVLHWRADAIPAMGTDPQAIINNQIGAEYDIFVGILWTRFGTPTPRAKSGFEEEFNNAYAQYQKDPNSKRVMLYFKSAPVTPESIDPDQLSALREFRARIKDQTLYSTFADREAFANGIRFHLTRHIQLWSRMQRHSGPQPLQPVAQVPIAKADTEAEEGLLDLMEVFTAEMAKAQVAVERIIELQSENTARTELNTKQLQAIAKEPLDQRNRLLKQLFSVVAGDLNNLAKGLNEQAMSLEDALAAAMEGISKALGYQEFWNAADQQQRAILKNAIEKMDVIIPPMDQSLAGLADTIRGLPRITTMFNRSKKNAIGAIDDVRAAVKRGHGLMADLLKSGYFGPEAIP
jgi:Domain of unknown function (DUF4062)